MEGKFEKFFDNATMFFSKTTNKELYKYRNILEFVNDSYVLVNPISEPNIRGMRENMDDNDKIAFDKFLERNWGIKSQTLGATDTEGAALKRQAEQQQIEQRMAGQQPRMQQQPQQQPRPQNPMNPMGQSQNIGPVPGV